MLQHSKTHISSIICITLMSLLSQIFQNLWQFKKIDNNNSWSGFNHSKSKPMLLQLLCQWWNYGLKVHIPSIKNIVEKMGGNTLSLPGNLSLCYSHKTISSYWGNIQCLKVRAILSDHQFNNNNNNNNTNTNTSTNTTNTNQYIEYNINFCQEKAVYNIESYWIDQYNWDKKSYGDQLVFLIWPAGLLVTEMYSIVVP